MLIGPDCALLYLYGSTNEKNDNDWLGGLTFCIGFVEYLVQAKLHVRLSWVSTEQIFMHLCICICVFVSEHSYRNVPNPVFSFFAMFPHQIILRILRIEQCQIGT
jgi:hypothetical protein